MGGSYDEPDSQPRGALRKPPRGIWREEYMLRKLHTVLLFASLLAWNVTASASYAPGRPDGSSSQSRPTGTNRSSAARRAFMQRSGYPDGRPGYVVDHIAPLCAGGADDPSNMQWQDVSSAKEKDKSERELCRNLRR